MISGTNIGNPNPDPILDPDFDYDLNLKPNLNLNLNLKPNPRERSVLSDEHVKLLFGDEAYQAVSQGQLRFDFIVKCHGVVPH